MADSTQVSKVLRAARELLAGGWCQKHLARTDDGSPVDYRDGAATAFCLLGACGRAALNPSDSNPDPLLMEAIGDALRHTVSGYAVDWNDTPGRTQAEVLAVIDATIAHLEAQ